jgi:hypothetical protein
VTNCRRPRRAGKEPVGTEPFPRWWSVAATAPGHEMLLPPLLAAPPSQYTGCGQSTTLEVGQSIVATAAARRATAVGDACAPILSPMRARAAT